MSQKVPVINHIHMFTLHNTCQHCEVSLKDLLQNHEKEQPLLLSFCYDEWQSSQEASVDAALHCIFSIGHSRDLFGAMSIVARDEQVNVLMRQKVQQHWLNGVRIERGVFAHLDEVNTWLRLLKLMA